MCGFLLPMICTNHRPRLVHLRTHTTKKIKASLTMASSNNATWVTIMGLSKLLVKEIRCYSYRLLDLEKVKTHCGLQKTIFNGFLISSGVVLRPRILTKLRNTQEKLLDQLCHHQI